MLEAMTRSFALGELASALGLILYRNQQTHSQSAAATGEPGSALDSLLAIQIDRPELIAVALTLGILCFAVVTSIMLVRTSRRLAETEASARAARAGRA